MYIYSDQFHSFILRCFYFSICTYEMLDHIIMFVDGWLEDVKHTGQVLRLFMIRRCYS